MIELLDLRKSFATPAGPKVVADGITAAFPRGAAVALLGGNGAGKSSLLRMIAGTLAPDSGEVRVSGTVSWPVGFAGSFHGDLSGRQNTRFVARVYGVDTDDLCAFVEDFAGIGAHFDLPVRTYSAGMRARLAFGVSMGIAFDTYLVDEVTSVGDAAFRRKCEAVFRSRLATSGVIVVSHSMGQIRRLCSAGAVLDRGQLTWHDSIEEAIRHHERLMGNAA